MYLIRHGEPEGHLAGHAQSMSGWTDVALSAAGREQIKRLCEHFRAAHLAFEAIYSSSLVRAVDTAAAIGECLGGAVVCLESLKEINCGAADGRSVRDVQRELPQIWAANLRQDDETFRWPGGESYREFRNRCVDAIRGIVRAHPDGRVAIVTHAGVISQFLGHLHGLSAAQWEPFRPGPSSVTQVIWREVSFRLVRFDDRSHLGASEDRR